MSTITLSCGYLLPAAAGMAVLTALQRAGLAPEWSRKLLHVGCGLLALSLPWLCGRGPTVLALCSVAALMLVAVRFIPAWNRKLGGALDGVGRGHRGAFYFVAAIGLVFAGAGGDRLLFCLPIAVLTFADAAAALVGRRLGVHRFRTGSGWKSLEGSCAFFAVGLAAAFGCLSAFDGGDPARHLPLALLLALLLTFVEAAAGKGLDNLLIPVVGQLALRAYLGFAAADLIAHLCAAAASGILVAQQVRRHLPSVDSEPWRTTCGLRTR